MNALLDHSNKRPTILATGVAGYIGSHFALACLEAGWRVIGIDDLSVGSLGAVPDGVEFRQLDCGDPQIADLIKDTGVNAVVHFAALVSVEESFHRPDAYYRTNVAKALDLFDHASRSGVSGIVFSSTAAVYGEAGNEPVDETTPLAPKSPYGRTKLAAEWLLADVAARNDMPHVVLRYFNVAGADPQLRAGPRPGATHLMKIVAEAATGQRKEVVINGNDFSTADGTGVRDYIHVSDLADAHVAAVRHLLDGGRSLTLNVGYGKGYSVREVINTAADMARESFAVRVGPRRAGDIEFLVADATALRSELGWTPQRADLTLVLKTAIDWEVRQLTASRTIATG